MADLDNTLRTVAQKVGEYVENLATLTVETKTINAAGGTETVIARSVLRIDGDSEALLPVDDAGNVRTDLLELHRQNVVTAMSYRSQIVSALLMALTQRSG
jgi:hypothetical protein